MCPTIDLISPLTLLLILLTCWPPKMSSEPLSSTDVTDSKESKRANRLKRRLDKDTTVEDLLEGWTQCCYLVPRKQKLCNVARSMHSMFCGNHQPAESVVRDEDGNEAGSLEESTGSSKKDKKERVPCPIDPTHTIFKHSLNYHVKVCTKLKQSAAMSEQVFYREDCNSYSVTCLPCEKSIVTSEQALLETAIDPDVLAAKVNAAYALIQARCTEAEDVATFHDTTAPTTTSTATATNTTSTANTTASTLDYSNANADTALAAKIATKLGQDLTSFSKMRHVDQDILLVQQMRDRGLIKTHTVDGSHSSSHNAVYVELGAGRGLLSYAVSCADPTATVVLVERYGSKKKVDKALKEGLAELKIAAGDVTTIDGRDVSTIVTGDIKRVRMDIRHCYLPLLPGVVGSDTSSSTAATTISTTTTASGKQPVVVIAKHLCGVATDLAIQSVRSFPHIPRVDGAATTADATHEVGIAIATCCHHACHFPDYTGREWYLSQGFTEAEFEVLKKWSGWSTNAVAVNNSNSSAGGNADVNAEKNGDTTNTDTTNTTNTTNTSTTEHAAPLNPQVIRPSHISSAGMQTLGFRVKRIIDQGRVEYINAHYTMRAKQVRYCERRLSPECVLLVATQL